MALVWADFPSGQRGLYGTTIGYTLNGVWAAMEGAFASSFISLTTDPDPLIGSNGVVVRFNQSSSTGTWSQVIYRLTYPEVVDTAGMSFRMWISEYPEADSFAGNPLWKFRTISNADVVTVRVGASGQLLIYNNAGTLIHTSDPAVVIANAYNHVETKVVRHASAGTIEIRVNGIPKVTLDTLALGATDIANACLGQLNRDDGYGGSINAYFKDVVFWDGTGGYIDDFQGSVAVWDLIPDADIDLQWTPSTGSTGFDLVDEGTSGPTDTDYISADDTFPAPTIFNLSDLPPDVTSVRAVMPIGRMLKTDGGDCTVQISVSPDGIAYDDGEDRPITVAATYWWDKSYVSPDTGVAWTPDEVNDMVYKINRTT